MNEPVVVHNLSNWDFLESHSLAGRVGLVGGTTPIEKVIRRAERHVDENERRSLWSHAMLSEGKRAGGHHFMQYVFARAGVDLAPGIHASRGTSEDISRPLVPHATYLLQR